MMGYRTRYSGGGLDPVGLPGLFTTGYYYPPMIPANDGIITPTQNWEIAVPFYVAKSSSFDRIACEVTTGAASTTIRLGVRSDSGNGAPSALLLDAGTVDSSSNGTKTITISLRLTPGMHWLTMTLQGGTGVSCRGRSVSGQFAHDIAGNANSCGWYQSGITGALAASYTPTGSSQAGPKILLRAA